jgi:hypothetical protein
MNSMPLRVLRQKKRGARKTPVFIYSAACARKRLPITSIKSQNRPKADVSYIA